MKRLAVAAVALAAVFTLAGCTSDTTSQPAPKDPSEVKVEEPDEVVAYDDLDALVAAYIEAGGACATPTPITEGVEEGNTAANCEDGTFLIHYSESIERNDIGELPPGQSLVVGDNWHALGADLDAETGVAMGGVWMLDTNPDTGNN